ncbi:O-antigen ligase family protein [Paenibacillus prosopidis]|uniref:O-antigen ligase n=1 Tax=Paenibacillus prosopidis TaxID=630520 RepID=A0A368VQQ3_9BACL|nr:O-antigen ligase family protein [Paenibacillus prosopidis]RCW44218.1 O-antigen ligase [Paenibacillus prosopidis]
MLINNKIPMVIIFVALSIFVGASVSAIGVKSLYIIPVIILMMVVPKLTKDAGKISIIGILFFLPFQNVLVFDVGLFSLKMSQIFLFIGLLYLFMTKQLSNQMVPVMLVVPILMSLFNSIDINRSVTLLFAVILLIGMYIVIRDIARISKKETILKVIIWSGVISSLYGIYQYIGFYMGIDTGIHYYVWDPRPKVNSFSVPNQFSNFLLLPIAVSMYAIKVYGKKYILPLLICSSALVLTFSTGAIISLVLSVIIYALIVSKTMRRVSLGLGAILFVITSIAYIADPGIFNLNKYQGFIDGRTTERILLWDVATKMFLEHPIVGSGLNTFPLHAVYEITYLTFERNKEVHNTFLTVLAELGIVGMLFFGTAVGFIFFQAIRRIKHTTGEQRILVSCLLIASLTMLIQYFTDNGLYSMHLWATFALLKVYSEKVAN